MEESEIHQKIVLNLSEVQIETIRNLFGFYNWDFDGQLDQNFGGNLQNVGKVTEEKGVQTDDQTLQDVKTFPSMKGARKFKFTTISWIGCYL